MANDMKGLYEKVIRGSFPAIQGYSQDLSTIVTAMLQVNPVMRPTCAKILEMDLVRRHMKNFSGQVGNNDLLSTIKFIPSFRELNSRLPAANYEKRGRNKSIGVIDDDRSESLGRPRPEASVENRREQKIHRVQGLPPRYGYRQENSEIYRYGNNDISSERKVNRNDSYNDDRNRHSRALLQAGANVLHGEASTPKPISMKKGNFERVLSEPALEKPRYSK